MVTLGVADRRSGEIRHRSAPSGGASVRLHLLDLRRALDHRGHRTIGEQPREGELEQPMFASLCKTSQLLDLAFSTTHRYPRAGGIAGPTLETDEDRIDALYEATADATEAAIDDAPRTP